MRSKPEGVCDTFTNLSAHPSALLMNIPSGSATFFGASDRTYNSANNLRLCTQLKSVKYIVLLIFKATSLSCNLSLGLTLFSLGRVDIDKVELRNRSPMLCKHTREIFLSHGVSFYRGFPPWQPHMLRRRLELGIEVSWHFTCHCTYLKLQVMAYLAQAICSYCSLYLISKLQGVEQTALSEESTLSIVG